MQHRSGGHPPRRLTPRSVREVYMYELEVLDFDTQLI